MTQFALFNLMGRNAESERPEDIVRDTVRFVRAAEESGLDGAWFAEHHASDFSVCPSPLAMAIHCAGVTRRIALGPAMVVMPFYHPLRLLEEIGLMEALSEGRTMLGIASGHQPPEFRAMDVPIGERHARMIELIEILEAGLARGQVNHAGRFYRVPDSEIALKPWRGRRIPLFTAGHEPNLVRRAVAAGAVPFISQGSRPLAAGLKMKADLAAMLGAEAATLPFAIQRYVFVTSDKSEARAAAEGLLRFSRRMVALRQDFPQRQGIAVAAPAFAGEPSIDSLLVDGLIGEAAMVVERMRAELAALKPVHMSLYMSFAPLPAAATEAAIRRFGRDVLPHLCMP